MEFTGLQYQYLARNRLAPRSSIPCCIEFYRFTVELCYSIISFLIPLHGCAKPVTLLRLATATLRIEALQYCSSLVDLVGGHLFELL